MARRPPIMANSARHSQNGMENGASVVMTTSWEEPFARSHLDRAMREFELYPLGNNEPDRLHRGKTIAIATAELALLNSKLIRNNG